MNSNELIIYKFISKISRNIEVYNKDLKKVVKIDFIIP